MQRLMFVSLLAILGPIVLSRYSKSVAFIRQTFSKYPDGSRAKSVSQICATIPAMRKKNCCTEF
jgi:hypothetical protein